MESNERMVGMPCPPCESAPFLENRGQAAGPQGPGCSRRAGPCSAACCAAKGHLWLCLGRYCLCPCVSGRGLAVLGTAGFPQLFARGPWHGCFLRFVCRRGAVLFISGRKKAHAGKLVLAGRDAVPGAFLCPAYGGTLLGVLHYLALLLVAQYWVLCAAGQAFETGKNFKLAFAGFVQCRRHFALGQFYAPAPPRFGQGQSSWPPAGKVCPAACGRARAQSACWPCWAVCWRGFCACALYFRR